MRDPGSESKDSGEGTHLALTPELHICAHMSPYAMHTTYKHTTPMRTTEREGRGEGEGEGKKEEKGDGERERKRWCMRRGRDVSTIMGPWVSHASLP